MTIFFISPSEFKANNSIQIHNLSLSLCSFGHKCIVAVIKDSLSCYRLYGGNLPYFPISYDELHLINENLEPDIIHCWTPREHVRSFAAIVVKKYPRAKLIVHLEDNEEFILSALQKYPFKILKKLNPVVLNRILFPFLSHPTNYLDFLEKSDGITFIINTLNEFNFSNKKSFELWPIIIHSEFSRTKTEISEIKSQLKIEENEIVVSYTGDVHQANFKEVSELYDAVKSLKSKNYKIRLIRTGQSIPEFIQKANKLYSNFEYNLGFVSRKTLFDILSISSILIQPGENNHFNNYRLPSKIPEFLSSGRPTAIPRSNLAFHLKNGENALILKKGDKFEIEDLILKYINNILDFDQIGKKGKAFSIQNFSSENIVNGLIKFYQQILSSEIRG